MTLEQQTVASLEARCEGIRKGMNSYGGQELEDLETVFEYIDELSLRLKEAQSAIRRPVEAKEIRHIRERHEGIDSQCLGPEEMELWEHVGRLLKALAESQRLLQESQRECARLQAEYKQYRTEAWEEIDRLSSPPENSGEAE